MIIWRSGKGGFVGGLKYAIRGFIASSHSNTSETPIPPAPPIAKGLITNGAFGNGVIVRGSL